jgi:hypothetical protein
MHGFFPDALAFAGVANLKSELLGCVRGNGDAASAGIEQKVERAAAIEARFDEDAIIDEVERQREGSLGIGDGGRAAMDCRKRKCARERNQEAGKQQPKASHDGLLSLFDG